MLGGLTLFLDHPGIEKSSLRDSGCLNDSSHMFRGNVFLKTLGGLVRTCFKLINSENPHLLCETLCVSLLRSVRALSNTRMC